MGIIEEALGTREEKGDLVDEALGNNKSGGIFDKLSSFGKPQEQPTTFGNAVKENIQSPFKAVADNLIPAGETALAIATGIPASLAGLAGSIGMSAVKGPEEGKKFREYVTDIYSYKPKTPAAQGAMNVMGKALSPLGYPRKLAESLGGEQWGNLADVTTIGVAANIPSLRNARNAAQNIQKKIHNVIDTGIEKGIRPSVVGKKTSTQYETYKGRARDAVQDIINNKDSLMLENAVGEIVTGELPKNLKQFSEAITQRKRSIFEQYNSMAQNAGEKGITVDLRPIANELTTITNSTILRDLRPDIVNYADDMARRLFERKNYTPVEAQEAIATINQGLDAFYKNPTYENATKASIDVMIANNLRQSLDKSIGNLKGPNYQALKNKYGSLSGLEKDVTHRMIVDARKNVKGLPDISDVYTGYQVINGLLSTNAVQVVAGTAAKGISSLWKRKNNPNIRISNMFKTTEKLMNQQNQFKPPKMPPGFVPDFDEAFAPGSPQQRLLPNGQGFQMQGTPYTPFPSRPTALPPGSPQRSLLGFDPVPTVRGKGMTPEIWSKPNPKYPSDIIDIVGQRGGKVQTPNWELLQRLMNIGNQ